MTFVCVPRQVARTAPQEGGPARYRATHAATLWRAGEAPSLRRIKLAGDAELSG